MKKLFVLIAATVLFSQAHAQEADLIASGYLTLFMNYSKVEGQKATYSSKTTLSAGDAWSEFPSADVLFPADTGVCFSGNYWTVEWMIKGIVDQDEAYKLIALQTSEDEEEIFFAIQYGKKLVKSFKIHRCI
jgi:hypothetical protein